MPDLNLQPAISETELEQLSAVNPAEIRFAAMDLLSRREHSLKELRQKLKRRFDDEELIECEIQRLADENLQSDKRFAESFLRQRLNRGHGPLRIKQDMRQRGIPDSDVAAAIMAEQPDWYSRARDVIERKFGAVPAQDIKEKARRSRFMQYRGFSSDHFRALL